jgi:phosphatidate phosphatase APP1
MKIHSESAQKISLWKKIKRKIFFLLRLNHHPVIKVYHGYGNEKKIVVMGHVLKLSPFPRKTYRPNWLVNLFSMLRMFMVIPYSGAKISIEWQEMTYYATAGEDGFFKFEFFPEIPVVKGWQKIEVTLEEEKYRHRMINGVSEIYVPYPSQHGFISDIDDTFLISYSARFRRKLYVLFTKNAHSRKPFKGVVKHYQLLARHNRVAENQNPFFYVSGSEWNLYSLITEFAQVNSMPKGIFLLSKIKGLQQFWKTGSTNLMTKFARIVRIIEDFPHLQFVLLGDDTQIDVSIYLSVVKHFPGKIFAVYIRQVGKRKKQQALDHLKEMENLSVPCCYFRHSAEAIIHSEKIGLADQKSKTNKR